MERKQILLKYSEISLCYCVYSVIPHNNLWDSSHWSHCTEEEIEDLIDYAKALTVRITTNFGKFFKRWEYQTILPASWEICMQVKKQQLGLDMNWFQIGKGVHQGCILSPCLFNFYAEYIMFWNAGLDEAQTGIKIAGRNQ